MTKTTEKNIYQKINSVMRAEYYVKKDASVQGYKAVTHDAVTAHLHDAIVEAGIVISTSLIESTNAIVGKTSSGTNIVRYDAKYEVSFINIDEPSDRHLMIIEAHANDYGDKAPGKALSYATKSALLKIFFLEAGVNDEARIDAKRDAEKPKITKEQANIINAMVGDNGLDSVKFMGWIKKSMKAESIADLSAVAYDDVIKQLERSIKLHEDKQNA